MVIDLDEALFHLGTFSGEVEPDWAATWTATVDGLPVATVDTGDHERVVFRVPMQTTTLNVAHRPHLTITYAPDRGGHRWPRSR